MAEALASAKWMPDPCAEFAHPAHHRGPSLKESCSRFTPSLKFRSGGGVREQRKPLRAVCHSALPHSQHPFLWVIGLGAGGHNDRVIRSLAFTINTIIFWLCRMEGGMDPKRRATNLSRSSKP